MAYTDNGIINLKLYLLAFGDVTLIGMGFMESLSPILRVLGLFMGIIVGILTSMKMWQDYKKLKNENSRIENQNYNYE